MFYKPQVLVTNSPPESWYAILPSNFRLEKSVFVFTVSVKTLLYGLMYFISFALEWRAVCLSEEKSFDKNDIGMNYLKAEERSNKGKGFEIIVQTHSLHAVS